MFVQELYVYKQHTMHLLFFRPTVYVAFQIQSSHVITPRYHCNLPTFHYICSLGMQRIVNLIKGGFTKGRKLDDT